MIRPAADITSDHSIVALGGPGRRVKIYETSTGEEVANIKKHTDWVTSLSFSPDGVLWPGDRNGGLYVWEAQTGNLFTPKSPYKISYCDKLEIRLKRCILRVRGWFD